MAQDIYDYPSTLIPCNKLEPCLALVYDSITRGGHHPGRAEIYRAILRADEMFHDYAGYWPAPTYSCDEWAFKIGYMCGRLRLKNSKITKLGLETYNSIGIIPVATTDMTDEDGDNLWDTVTITVPVVSGVALDELAVYFVESDWPRGTDRCRNQLRPLTAKVVGDNWVISWNSTSFIKPKLYTGLGQTCIDPQDPDNYPTQVQLTRKWYDESKAVTVMRKPTSCVCGETAECYCCENAKACIVNAEAGIIELDMRGCGCCATCAQKLCINYVSGDCANENAELIAHFVASLIGREICCADNFCMKYWQEDYVAINVRGNLVTALNETELANPFGTKRGGLDLYRYLHERRAVRIIRI